MNIGSSLPQNSAAAPTWSLWPCVASAATGRLPAAVSSDRTRAAEKPGSTTSASSLPSRASSQQFVAYGLSANASR